MLERKTIDCMKEGLRKELKFTYLASDSVVQTFTPHVTHEKENWTDASVCDRHKILSHNKNSAVDSIATNDT